MNQLILLELVNFQTEMIIMQFMNGILMMELLGLEKMYNILSLTQAYIMLL